MHHYNTSNFFSMSVRGVSSILYLSFVANLWLNAGLSAQAEPKNIPAPEAKPAEKGVPAKKIEKSAKKGEVTEPVPEPVKESSWSARYIPAIGVLVPAGIPVSGINQYIGPGFGAELFGSIDIGHFFASQSQPYRIRAVLSASGYYYANKAGTVPATLMLFPVIGSIQFSYFTSKDTRAIVRVGAGASFDTLKINDATAAKTSDSSVSFLYQADIGGGYNFSNGMELLLLAGYMGQLQTVSASYLNVRLGVAWYF